MRRKFVARSAGASLMVALAIAIAWVPTAGAADLRGEAHRSAELGTLAHVGAPLAASRILAFDASDFGDLEGRLLVPDYFADGELCAELWTSPTVAEPEPEYLDSRCGSLGEDFVFEDLPNGSYRLAIRDSEDYAEWISGLGWGDEHLEHWVGDGTSSYMNRFLISNASSGPYVPGAPVTIQFRVSPRLTNGGDTLYYLRADGVYGSVVVPYSFTNGDATATFVPPAPGFYYTGVFRGNPTQYLESNWLWIGPPIHDVQLTGPTNAYMGLDMTFTVVADPPTSGTAYLWSRPVGGSWSSSGQPFTIANGLGTVTLPVPNSPREYLVEFGYGVSELFLVTPEAPVWPAVSRIGGATRYDVAVGISQEYFPDGADTVYIATGANFPDALGAAPAAALRDAPLLLVPGTSIPASVQAELERLEPDTIIVTGGPASVSPAVLAQLGEYATTVTRINGPDRYEVSRQVTRDAFAENGSSIAYIATGATFPDALSASAAAGALGAPVILVYGKATTLDAATSQLLQDLDVAEVRIAGGPASVSPGIEAALKNVPGVTTVSRLTGADRFVVSGATNRAAFTSADTVFIASGYTFPDALAGAPVAGAEGAPLYVVPSSCIPSYVLEDILNLGATEVRILGGPGSVTPNAAALNRC